jgi:N-acetylglutamate synthase-like GNAT family acetyltransferase
MFTLRSAQARDEMVIKGLIRETRLNPMGLKWPNFVVAEDEQGQFIGCGQIKTHKDGTRELASIAVVKAWRGRDVAKGS